MELARRIIWEDNHLLVVNKAPGEISQGDKTGDTPLPELLGAHIKVRDEKPGNVFLGLVHRLDRPTSGILVFAKTSKALSRLTASFRERDSVKIYHALVEGLVDEAVLSACRGVGALAQEDADFPGLPVWQLRHWLDRDPKANRSSAWPEEGKDRQEAVLDLAVLARGQRYSLVGIRLHTGRHHQIRAQLSACGLSIKGDLKYRSSRSNPDGGISLHAAVLSLPHPVGQRLLVAKASPLESQGDGRLWQELETQAGPLGVLESRGRLFPIAARPGPEPEAGTV